MRNHLVGLAAGAVLAFCAACGTTPDTEGAPTSAAGAPSVTTTLTQQAVGSIVPGYTVRIPTLDVSSSLLGVGLNPDRTLQTPPLEQPQQAAVYTRGPMPGETGPAIILGHINGSGRPGVFSDLTRLDEGDTIAVDTPDGPVSFEVYRVDTMPKAEFPTAEVYSDTDSPELRLITCGGELSGHHYLDQTVVFARAAT